MLTDEHKQKRVHCSFVFGILPHRVWWILGPYNHRKWDLVLTLSTREWESQEWHAHSLTQNKREMKTLTHVQS
jgi:hypothetical protein